MNFEHDLTPELVVELYKSAPAIDTSIGFMGPEKDVPYIQIEVPDLTTENRLIATLRILPDTEGDLGHNLARVWNTTTEAWADLTLTKAQLSAILDEVTSRNPEDLEE